MREVTVAIGQRIGGTLHDLGELVRRLASTALLVRFAYECSLDVVTILDRQSANLLQDVVAMRRLERNDPDLAEEIYKLVCMEPDEAAAWIRDHLDEIEARFAS
ncbi:MAG: hypothetical protein JWO36_5078 [Myxococcales bacterium]|nr:hypothetical protein [Myxococcales bacterium]